MLMRNLKLLFVVLGSFFIFTSCINIEEFVHFNADKSGTYRMTVDMGQMGSMMDLFGGMMGNEDSENNEDGGGGLFGGMGDIKSKLGDLGGAKGEMDSLLNIIGTVNGITKMKSNIEKNGMKISYEFNFSNIEALNKALKTLQSSSMISQESTDAFKVKGNKICRLQNDQMKDLLDGKDMNSLMSAFGGEEEKKGKKKKNNDEDNLFGDFDINSMMTGLGGDMTYTSIYEFDQVIKKTDNKNAEISEDGNTVTLVYYPLNTEKNSKKGMTNTIKLKKLN
ncbi:MAG: hypothetical protein IPI52_04270 [Bacteroidetes bacterium]|nr:hypothetical protein [Bacteroidota bacterium]